MAKRDIIVPDQFGLLVLVLVYRGKKPLRIYADFGQQKAAYVRAPKGWKWILHVYGYIGPPRPTMELKPGTEIAALFFLHQNYTPIPEGKADLTFFWPIITWERTEKKIAEPQVSVTVDIPPATPRNVEALCRRFEKELDRPELKPEKAKLIWECVRGTKHKGLNPVALKLLDFPEVVFRDYAMTQQVWDSNPDRREANGLFLRYVTRADALRPASPFFDWQRQKGAFREQQIQSLRNAKSPWVRLLTGVAFPKQCPAKWKAGLLSEMSKLAELPAAVEELRLLDDPEFTVREKATARLDAMEDLAEPAIRAHLKGPVSPEARRRCQQILADWVNKPHDYNLGSAFEVLERAANVEARAMLEALAKNPPDCRITRRAKEALDRRRATSQAK